MEELAETLKEIPIEYRPELRWWLAAGAHTDRTIKYEISRAHELGFGGMEFLATDEPGIDNARYGWGSEEWNHSSQLVADETTKRNMSVSFTSGTNWANANLPTIDPDHPAAAKELNVVHEDVKAGSKRSGKLPRVDINAFLKAKRHGGTDPRIRINRQDLIGVVAARILEEGETTILDAQTVDLTSHTTGESLEWEPQEGNWRLFVFWLHGSGQTASPSQSVNYTVNYFDRDGVEEVKTYWDKEVLTPELRKTISQNPRAQMYMDSLELFPFGDAGLLWGHTMLREFEQRRGYSIVPYLPFMIRKLQLLAFTAVFPYEPEASSKQLIEKIRFDLVRTFTDLYMENMMQPFREYLNKNGILLRSEISYGLPLELTRPAVHVDGLETESLEFGAQIDAYRLMGGAAHLLGKQYSSETGATSRNCMLEHRFYDQIIRTQLAAGITKTVLHGWSSVTGAEGTKWPGHEGMYAVFSERFDDRQPGSEFYPLWNQAIGRMQYILRQGKPRIDIGILRTDHCTDTLSGLATYDDDGYRVPDEVAYAQWWMRNRENHWWQDLGMQDAGWTYEFFDGLLLMDKTVSFDTTSMNVQPEGPGYQALVVYQSTLDPDVAKHLLVWAKSGLKVLLVHDTRELKWLKKKQYFYHSKAASSTQGLDGRDEELAETIKQLLALDNVAEVFKQSQTLDALRKLGVRGRAEFAETNTSVLSHIRRDGDISYVYLYHFLYDSDKPTKAEICFDGQGAVSRVDCWTPKVEPHLDCTTEDGRTRARVSLQPGETTILCLDRSKKPVAGAKSVSRTKVADLAKWTVSIEDWDAGEVEVIKEDRGKGYETIEHRPSTKITKIEVGGTKLVSWKDMPKVGSHVSGIGEYRTTVDLPEDNSGKVLLHLGSTCGGLGSVQVNGQSPRGFDTSGLEIDLTDLVRSGSNEIVVRVSSALNNRLLQRGYYEKLLNGLADLYGEWRKGDERAAYPRDHGLLGPVRILREEWQ